MSNNLEFIDPYDPSSANIFIRVEHLARYHFAAELIRKRRLKRVLDCACGNGYGCRILAERASVAGVDSNRELIERGSAINTEQKQNSIDLLCADLNGGLGMFGDGFFDLVTCFETLEHIIEEEALLGEFHRVLQRGGMLLLSVPKAGYEPADASGKPLNPHHLRLYSVEGLAEKLKACGFVVVKALGQPYTNVARANMESYRRDKGIQQCDIDGFFAQTPEALAFFAKAFGWPTAEHGDESNTLILLCRNTSALVPVSTAKDGQGATLEET